MYIFWSILSLFNIKLVYVKFNLTLSNLEKLHDPDG